MDYKENRKREAERWGKEANERGYLGHSRAIGKSHLVGSWGVPVSSTEVTEVVEPQYLTSMGDNRALKITPKLLAEFQTRWLICPSDQDFKVSGMVHYADQIKSQLKRNKMYIGVNTEITVKCIHPKRGIWRVYLRAW